MTKYAPPSAPMIAAVHHGARQTPRAIVIHGTVTPCDRGRARSIAAWWHDPKRSPVTSAHYVVDPGEVIQCVGDHTVAYHCGHNTGSIAVELCDPQRGSGKRWGDKAHRQMLARASKLVAQLCLAYGIEATRPTVGQLKAGGPHGIYGHNDSRLAFGSTTHVDPGPDFPWKSFLADVRAEMAAIQRAHKPAAKAPAKKPAKSTAPARNAVTDAQAHWTELDHDLAVAESRGRRGWVTVVRRALKKLRPKLPKN